MTRTQATAAGDRDQSESIGRRRVLAGCASVGVAALAGCGAGPVDSGGETGTFRLLISDQPTAISEFDSLTVTLSTARLRRADEGTTTGSVTSTPSEGEPTAPETTDDADDVDSDDPSVVEIDLEGREVDLTTVVGDRATAIVEADVPAGRYAHVELVVDRAEGVVDGESVDVRVPSGRLRLVTPFEVAAGETLDFVYDITVVRRGRAGGYNLTPVIGKSGVAGDDVDVTEVGTATEGS